MRKRQPVRFTSRLALAVFLASLFALSLCPGIASAAPTRSLVVRKVASDGTTVLAEREVDYTWLMDPENIPVLGDGETRYYHQGPVFVDHPDPETQAMLRWNPEEDTNVDTKDMGVLLGTNVRDLCELVGGMAEGDRLNIKAVDGLSKTFAFKNVYSYSDREGPMVVCWCKDGAYPDTGYRDGMRLVWFADDSTNPWGLHVFGNWDWHLAADEQYWYFFHSGDQKYPTTTGLSIQTVSLLTILSSEPPPAALEPEPEEVESAPKPEPKPEAAFTSDITEGEAPLTVTFRDQSLNQPTSWSWDLDGDGKEDDASQNPTYTYTEPGTYTVSLTASNEAGSDEAAVKDYIKVSPPAEDPAPVQTGPEDQEPPSSPRRYLPFVAGGVIVAIWAVGRYFVKLRQGGSPTP